MGLILLFAPAGAPVLKTGSGVGGMVGAGSNAITWTEAGKGIASAKGAGTPAFTPSSPGLYPTLGYQVAFTSQPLELNPTWVDLSSRVRVLDSTRGRSYEFDRMEAGTLGAGLSNRDAHLSPANSSSPYSPIRSTRPVRAFANWVGTYLIFRGISEGFPQAFPNLGKDAAVTLNSSDLFYGLNQGRFTPGSTALTVALVVGAASASETITVASTALPMPQVVPFVLTLDEGAANEEDVTVTAISNATQYVVTRSAEPKAHSAGAVVSTLVVSFASALSGTRIQQVLEAVGFDAAWYDLDAGQSIMAASEDLASVNPLEHINLITDAEFGRFFVSKDGKFTFRDRHSIILDFLTPVATFRDQPVSGSEIPYRIEGALEHSEEKLFNRVRITIPSGESVDIQDDASIAEHFERVFERQWPYASVNDAIAAAHFILGRSVEHSLRIPRLTVHPANNPSILWPLVLAREIGDRARFRYQPEGGGTEIDQEVIIEGVSHQVAPRNHIVSFQLTEADPNEYWILGLAGYGELGETTWVGF